MINTGHLNIKYICSPMNYIGGKYKLLPQIIPLFPQKIHTFLDLFCGGCNVGINVQANTVIFNDNLIFLIKLYKELLKHPTSYILNHIDQRIKEFNLSITNKKGFYLLRESYNQNKNPLDLFVLTAFAFNHQIRFNSNFHFNTPFGYNRSAFNPRMKKNLESFLSALHDKNLIFQSTDFRQFNYSTLTANDFVYCDPPYLITIGTYNDGKRGFSGWSIEEEKALLSLLDSLNQRKIKFALSNVLTHKGKENVILLQWIKERKMFVTHLHKSYYNSNYHILDRRKNLSKEVLITNYNPLGAVK